MHPDDIIQNSMSFVKYTRKEGETIMNNECMEFMKKCRQFLSNYVPFDKKNVFVAGGFFTRFYHDLPIRDIDVYVKKEYFSSVLDEYLKTGDYEPKTEYKDFYCLKGKELDIDLISFHEPQSMEFIESFDFMHCRMGLDEISTYYPGWHYMVDKKIGINTNAYDIRISSYVSIGGTISRLIKYINMGFTISPQEILLLEHYITQKASQAARKRTK